MAIVIGKFVHGTAGSAVYKKFRDKQVVQGKSKKKQIDMTAATYDAAYIFGRASTLASYIRNGVDSIVAFNDGGMISRFTGECNQIIQKVTDDKGGIHSDPHNYFSRLNGFEFHQGSPVKNYLFAQPMVTLKEQDITIDIPEMDIPKDLKSAPDAKYCTVAFSVALFDLKNNKFMKQEVQSFEIELKPSPFTFPAQQLKFEAAPGALCIIGLGLFYSEKTFIGKVVINSKTLSPAAILKAAFCPGEIVLQPKWHKMVFQDKKKRKKLPKAKTEGDDQPI